MCVCEKEEEGKLKVIGPSISFIVYWRPAMSLLFLVLTLGNEPSLAIGHMGGRTAPCDWSLRGLPHYVVIGQHK